MRRAHLGRFAPICPACAVAGRAAPRLRLAECFEGDATEITQGLLGCDAPACRARYPIIDRIPVIVPDLPGLLRERAIGLLLRRDLPPALDDLVGEAIGPDTWLDRMRRTVSTYAFDAWDEAEGSGAGARCLARLLELAGPPPGGLTLDLGCGAGRSTVDLAAADPAGLVLGIDLDLALLRVAQDALQGALAYPLRRNGLQYEHRHLAVPLPPEVSARTDFWCCDALALPFGAAFASRIAALHLLDSIAEPASLLRVAHAALVPRGELLLATPWDWSGHATPAGQWLGGRGGQTPGAAFREAASQAGLEQQAEQARFPWQTRLHDRASISYDAQLAVLARPAIA